MNLIHVASNERGKGTNNNLAFAAFTGYFMLLHWLNENMAKGLNEAHALNVALRSLLAQAFSSTTIRFLPRKIKGSGMYCGSPPNRPAVNAVNGGLRWPEVPQVSPPRLFVDRFDEWFGPLNWPPYCRRIYNST